MPFSAMLNGIHAFGPSCLDPKKTFGWSSGCVATQSERREGVFRKPQRSSTSIPDLARETQVQIWSLAAFSFLERQLSR